MSIQETTGDVTAQAAETVAPAKRSSRLTGENAFGGLSQVLLIVWAILVIFPFLWMVMTSFKTDPEIIFSPWKLPASLQWNNFERAWNQAHIGTYFKNTIIVVSGSVFLTLLFSSMAAYVLARFEFRGNRIIFYLFMLGLMFPVFLALVPLFFVVNDLHMLSTYRGLILVYVAYSLPFSIFFLTSFFKTLPSELAEAAILDGASHYRVFFGIMLPLAKPGLLAIGIFNVLGQWNQFILPLVLNPDPNNYLITQGLAFLAIQQGYQNDYSALFAALTITMIPILVVYIVFQRRLEAGLTAGALKG
ncbi:MAG TPA: carbohydrate ABC transporter permease [Thermomicrobiales bacterium]|nr:carbohydrate ABC transporter permease [Thermomicrobiales bacterium]